MHGQRLPQEGSKALGRAASMEGFTLTLSGRKALVTGGARGIGRAIALALVRAGSAVIVSYRHRQDAASEVVEAIRGTDRKAAAVQADVANPAEAAGLVEAASSELGGWTCSSTAPGSSGGNRF